MAKVKLIDATQLPKDAIMVGTIFVGEAGLSVKCSYEACLNKILQKSKEVGGNRIVVKEHTFPNAWSSCHQLTADIYYVED